MNSIEMHANAKINLSIDVLRKREDGYHDVELILQEVGLFDVVHMEKRKAGIEISCSLPYIPVDERNTAYRAARDFFEHTGIDAGAGITIKKNIPVCAGLGGGSSDAASVLKGLDRLFDTNLTEQELIDLAERIGSDVPFFIKGDTAICSGKGEKVQKIDTELAFDILILKPEISVSTRVIYENIDINDIKKRPMTQALVDALKANDDVTVIKNLVNVLERVTFKLYPGIRDVKNKLLELGALNALMSGSGSAVFGIFKNRYEAVAASDKIKNDEFEKFYVKTKVKQ